GSAVGGSLRHPASPRGALCASTDSPPQAANGPSINTPVRPTATIRASRRRTSQAQPAAPAGTNPSPAHGTNSGRAPPAAAAAAVSPTPTARRASTLKETAHADG